MAYNRKNLLKRAKRIVEIYKREKKPGLSDAFIFRTYIEPDYDISIATYYNYLAMPVDAEMKKIEASSKADILKQTELF